MIHCFSTKASLSIFYSLKRAEITGGTVTLRDKFLEITYTRSVPVLDMEPVNISLIYYNTVSLPDLIVLRLTSSTQILENQTRMENVTYVIRNNTPWTVRARQVEHFFLDTIPVVLRSLRNNTVVTEKPWFLMSRRTVSLFRYFWYTAIPFLFRAWDRRCLDSGCPFAFGTA